MTLGIHSKSLTGGRRRPALWCPQTARKSPGRCATAGIIWDTRSTPGPSPQGAQPHSHGLEEREACAPEAGLWFASPGARRVSGRREELTLASCPRAGTSL